ncbi:hypothetical protein M9H77_26134 [Catharanthus roseus]|uniref:Uncharacterized protein n=1 Tax=Catharanthus roseus TaxID=4058 RepID=A0ACC0A995_CATRO|nr:hypothetical protein M9H77_26134 [Catharanthus roseus]
MAANGGIKLFGATIEIQQQGRSQLAKLEKEEAEKGGDRNLHQLKRPDKIIACPRCKSMETKFCYFNNYNVNQPRHFCKGCQRYWTAGGALRNVPVGAGRRKSKPPCSRGGLSDGCLFDASAEVHRFDFDGVVEEWHVATAEQNDHFQHIFPAKRRRPNNNTSSNSQLC